MRFEDAEPIEIEGAHPAVALLWERIWKRIAPLFYVVPARVQRPGGGLTMQLQFDEKKLDRICHEELARLKAEMGLT